MFITTILTCIGTNKFVSALLLDYGRCETPDYLTDKSNSRGRYLRSVLPALAELMRISNMSPAILLGVASW